MIPIDEFERLPDKLKLDEIYKFLHRIFNEFPSSSDLRKQERSISNIEHTVRNIERKIR